MGFGIKESDKEKDKKNKEKKPVDTKGKEKKPMDSNTIRNLIIFASIFLLLISTIGLYNNNEHVKEFFDKHIFRKNVYENNLPFIAIDSVNTDKIYAFYKNIMILDQNVLRAYNRMGNEEYSIDVKIKQPIFASKGNYLCLADKNGKKIYLISGKEIIWQKDLDGEISDIGINKNGYVAVSMSDISYQTIVEVYDNNGSKLLSKYLSTGHVIDIDISNDNKHLAIAEANFSGIVIQSNVKIISIEDAKRNIENPAMYTYIADAGDLIISIEYNNKDNLICMYDGHIEIIKNNKSKETILFFNEDFLFADIGLSTSIVQILRQSTGAYSANAELQIINSTNTNSKKVYTIDEIPQRVYTYDSMIAINLGTEALFINSNGWLAKRYTSSQEIKDLVFSNNLAGIIYNNKIEIISF